MVETLLREMLLRTDVRWRAMARSLLVGAALTAVLSNGGAGLSAGAAAPGVPVQLRSIATGFNQPVFVTHAGDRSGRLFVVEQAGLVRVVRDGRILPAPFLDIRRKVIAGGELGLLSIAFHPRYATSGRFFLNYTSQEGRLKTVIAESRASAGNPDVADPAERVLMEIGQPFRNHNGGLNLFGPDGMLYVGMGDGGSAGDPQNNGQRLDTLLGKVLRLDVEGDAAYRIPSDNPFVGRAGARPEIWAYGLRNPWRYSFDRSTGRLFLADVGQNAWEEVDLVERGGNYGWNIMEGTHCHKPSEGCATAGMALPIAEYSHADGCSVTGGYVYRGARLRGLTGRYLFGDYCSGRLWMLSESGGRWVTALLLDTGLQISSFGEDQDGEIYVVDHRGGLYLLTGR